jgi:hypothetical protein
MPLDPTTPLAVYNTHGAVTSKSVAAPRFVELWNGGMDKLLHDPHLQVHYHTLGDPSHLDRDYNVWHAALQETSPRLQPRIEESNGMSQSTSYFSRDYPGNIYFNIDLVEALEAAIAGALSLLNTDIQVYLRYLFQIHNNIYVFHLLSFKQYSMRVYTGL